MKRKNRIIKIIVALLITALTLSFPVAALAQEVLPPVVQDETGISEDDILVFEPQLYWEFPFAQGFKISFNFGISLEVPRFLNLVEDDVFNFFLRFRSFVRPAETSLPTTPATPTMAPTVFPTPESTLTPNGD